MIFSKLIGKPYGAWMRLGWLLALLLAACSATGSLNPATQAENKPTSQSTPTPTITIATPSPMEKNMDGTDLPQATQKRVNRAVQDLAERLAIDENQIEVLQVKSVVWPDASLGCPKLGMVYKQVPQDGILIRLQAESRSYEYHGGGGREPFLCEKRLRPPTKPDA
jgi:hypothetical protein